MLEWVRFFLTAAFMLLGLFLMITGVIGDSLGLLMVICGLCISAPDGWVVLKFLLTAFFLWITSPTAGHLIARLELTLNEHPEQEMEVVEK